MLDFPDIFYTLKMCQISHADLGVLFSRACLPTSTEQSRVLHRLRIKRKHGHFTSVAGQVCRASVL